MAAEMQSQMIYKVGETLVYLLQSILRCGKSPFGDGSLVRLPQLSRKVPPSPTF